jgi:hypothetical protein
MDLDYRGVNLWQRCFSEKGVYLPTGMHFGFSAMTGGLSGKSRRPGRSPSSC